MFNEFRDIILDLVTKIRSADGTISFDKKSQTNYFWIKK